MAEAIFDPTRVLAELNAHGVRFVLVGDLARHEPGSPFTTDRVEICVADDEDDIDRLRVVLAAHEAEMDEPSHDPHRAVFRIDDGRLECVEMPAHAEFADLERRATHVDFGNGVIVRASPKLEAPRPRPVESARPADEPILDASRRSLRQRVWKRLEEIDDVLSGLNEAKRL